MNQPFIDYDPVDFNLKLLNEKIWDGPKTNKTKKDGDAVLPVYGPKIVLNGTEYALNQGIKLTQQDIYDSTGI